MTDATTTTTSTRTVFRSRQAELVDAEILETPVTLIGAGAIGSFTALCLAKMGFYKIEVYDPDSVSAENISNQFYRYKDIGYFKTVALREMLYDFEGMYPFTRQQLWEPAMGAEGIVISAVDSMSARSMIYKSLRRNSSIRGFIDGRMGGQQAEVYAIMPQDRDQQAIYEQYLWTDDEASELRCTQKAVMYNVLWIASTIANTARLMLEHKPYHHVQYMDFENQVHHVIDHTQEEKE